MLKRVAPWSLVSMALGSMAIRAQTGPLKPYIYAADGFSIAAPLEPGLQVTQEQAETGLVPKHIYTIDIGNDSGVMVSVVDFKNDKIDPQKAAQDAKNGQVARMRFKITREGQVMLG